MSNIQPAKRPRAPFVWGPAAMRNPHSGAVRYDPSQENILTGKTIEEGSAQSAGNLDHGTLLGLGDDDHTLYLLASGARAVSGSFTLQAGLIAAIETVTDTSALLDSSHFTVLCDCTSNVITINLPAAASHSGRIYNIKKIDSTGNAVTIDGNSSETIDGSTTHALSSQFDSVTIQSDGSNWHIL